VKRFLDCSRVLKPLMHFRWLQGPAILQPELVLGWVVEDVPWHRRVGPAEGQRVDRHQEPERQHDDAEDPTDQVRIHDLATRTKRGPKAGASSAATDHTVRSITDLAALLRD